MEEQNKNKTTATKYAFAGGFLGTHYYYLEQVGKGILCTLSTIILLSIILPMIVYGAYEEGAWVALTAVFIGNFSGGVRLSNMTQDRFDLKYNKHMFSKKTDQRNDFPIIGTADELQKLNLLFEQGIISFEDFERRKKQLLD